MGTNYYIQDRKPCSECGRPYDQKHIGKSSGGWCFSLHIYPKEGIHDLEDWEKVWQDKTIRDDCGSIVSKEEMLDKITNRFWGSLWGSKGLPFGHTSWEEFHKVNHSEEGPNGLVRHKIDQVFCIGHGEGTWDLIARDFS